MSFTLFRNHFQVAYVVRDMDCAIERFSHEFAVSEWQVMVAPSAARHGGDGAVRKSAGAYVGELMLELIEPDLDNPSIFSAFLPAAPQDFRMHHLGFMLHSAEDYQQGVARLNELGYPMARAGSWGEVLDFHIADTTALLGHYCELIYSKAKGEKFFKNFPRN